MTLEQAKKDLSKLQAKMCAYNHAMGLIDYDGVTCAPKGTAENRAQTLSVLSEESYKLSTGDETVALLEYLDAHRQELSYEEARQVSLLIKDIKQMKLIPLDEYIAYRRLLVEADDVWRTAKETNDFALFEPCLEKIFETNIRFAGYFAPDKNPYDFWLNEYEEGLNTKICDEFFKKLRTRLVPLIAKATKAQPIDVSVLKGNFPEEAQKQYSLYLMQLIGLDLDHVGLATTEHPFTASMGSHFDERITTHYYPDDFVSSMYSVIHEGGHALYDTGSNADYAYTAIDGGVSMGIHESQSRFYENILGRSLEFITYVFPKIQELFPSTRAHTAEEFWRAVNRVEPSLIRTESDEVTYCLHIMVRYELERRVMSGELSVHDLPKEWNRLYKEYLGVTVPDDKCGVLQDSHWAGGAIGYFPSYALGSAYGAQFLAKMKESVDIAACLSKGNFDPINEWNRQNIWQHGSLYTPQQLLERVLGAPLDADYYLDYLEEKVKKVYKLK